MADLNLEEKKVQFGYTVASTDSYNYPGSGAADGEIVFVQTPGGTDGVIFINDKQFSVRKSDFDSLKSVVDSITGDGGTTIDLSGLNTRLTTVEGLASTNASSIIDHTTAIQGIIDSIGQLNSTPFSGDNTIADAIQEVKDNLKTITINSVALDNNNGNWIGTINASNITLSSDITSSIASSIDAGSSIQEALSVISGRIDTLIDGTGLATAFDTIKEISEYLKNNDTAITDLSTLQGRVDDLETNLGQATSDIAQATADIAQATADIDALETNLEQATTIINNLVDSQNDAGTGNYITGINIDSTGEISISTAVLNGTAVSRTATQAASDQIALSATTVEGALIELAKGVKTAEESGVTSLTTHGLLPQDATGTSGPVELVMFGTSIKFGTSGEAGGLITLTPESSIAENVSKLNVSIATAVGTITLAIGTVADNLLEATTTMASLISENLTWHMFSGAGNEENP